MVDCWDRGVVEELGDMFLVLYEVVWLEMEEVFVSGFAGGMLEWKGEKESEGFYKYF